jgi:predicted AlkP superfamily pyrophosphatase or phosphodiesterase
MKKIVLAFVLGFLMIPAIAQQKTKKALFIIVDGIPADVVDTVPTPNIDQISKIGGFTKALMGGDVGTYSQTPTISAVGYNSLLTGVWANKHNVWGNGIEDPNYHYWTIFRAFKQANPSRQTAIFSTWLDNRTKLVGDNIPQTGNFAFDYYFDGFELDTLSFPHQKDRSHIHQIDETVSKEAARYIREKAPDLSWMYLEYSDDMGHTFGNSPQMVDGVQKADTQIGRVWEAIQYREKNFDEDWLIVITTDHGRTADGFGHGGHSERERTIWIATNAQHLNSHFGASAEMVDIFPSIARHLGLELPKRIAMELDGSPFVGSIEATDLKAELVDGNFKFAWKPYSSGKTARVWVSTTNHFQTGGLDNYWLMGEVQLDQGNATIPSKGMTSDFYKIVLETPSGYLNYWIVAK